MKSLRQSGALSAIIFVCALLADPRDISGETLPSGWSSQDINATGGDSSSSNGTWTISGSGANIWGSADGFQFTYRSLSGDFDYAVRLTAFDASNEWSKAGVMVRETLAANAKNAFAMFSPGTGPALQYRTATGGITARVTGGMTTPPTWLRLVRKGTQFTVYTSTTGSTWTTIGGITISMGSTAYVGFAVTSRDVAATSSAQFANVQLQTGTTSAPSAGVWEHRDIGAPPLAGSFTNASGTYTVVGSGIDIWDTSDQFHFAYQALTGDTEIIARVSRLIAPLEWSKAGVMIRQSLSAGSPHAFMMLSGNHGYGFQRRLVSGGTSYHSWGPGGIAPGWVRLTREGDVISAYSSSTGSSWTLVDTDVMSMPGTIYVGLAVTSTSADLTATAAFTNVTIRPLGTSSNQPPMVALTAPAAGATYTAPATIGLAASASDADGTISRVDFYRGTTLIASDTTSPYTASWSSAPAGTYSLTAVAFDNEGASATSPAVSVTVNSATNQTPSVSFVSPSQGATYTAPATVYIEAAASDADGTISRVDLYEGSTLLKSDLTAPYSHSWTNVPAGTYTLTATARDNSGLTRSTTVTITVNPAGNQLPNVSITSPTNGATYTAPATVTVQASASDADGTIARVEFYRDSTLIAADTTSPYSATWSSAPAGSYALTARAYDNSGGSGTSSAVNISIASATNQLPTVSITNPTSGATFVAPASITIAANAADSDGTVARVDFYVGSQLIATDTSSPYTASWANVAAGTYSLTAVARDNAGGTRTSSAIVITVGATALQPATLVFVASADHETNVTSYVVAIYRSVDPVTASPMGTRDLGKPTPDTNGEISVDISTLVNPLGAGSFYAVVRATGPGGTTASAPSATFTN